MSHSFSSIRPGIVLACVLLACAGVAQGATQDSDFLAARDAFRAGDAVKLERYAKALNDHPLEPYIAYWRLRLHLDETAPADVQAMLARLQDSPVSSSPPPG